MQERGKIHKIIINFIVISLFLVLLGKFVFTLNQSILSLYLYGILVTLMILISFFISVFKYKDPYLIAKRNKGLTPQINYFVSIIVAVRDEEKIIELCIDSLISQDYKHKEIIIINDKSTDGTEKILNEYAKNRLIRVIHLENNIGKKRALGKGMLKARGEIFVFTDSDSVVEKTAVSKLVDIFNFDPLIGAVSGHCRALNGDENFLTKVQDSWYEGQFSIRKAFESVYNSVSCVSGPLAAFRKESIFNFIPAWENDMFLGQEFRFATDRTLTGFVLGSIYIGEKLKEKYKSSLFMTTKNYPLKNWKVVYSKSARALTNVPNTFIKVIHQQIRWKKSFIRNIFFTGKFYWHKPLLVSLAYYLHIVFVCFGPFIALKHLIYLPLRGNLTSGYLYLAGIIFVGFIFGLAYRLENNDSHKWMYRPFMSLLSTTIFSWLIFYSALTIKQKIWRR